MICAMDRNFDTFLAEATRQEADEAAWQRTAHEHYVALTARLRGLGLLDDETGTMAMGLGRAITDIELLRDFDAIEQAHMEFAARLIIANRDERVHDVFLRYAGIDMADFDEAVFTAYVTDLVGRMEYEQFIDDNGDALMTEVSAVHRITQTRAVTQFSALFVAECRIMLTRSSGYSASDRQSLLEDVHASINRRRLPRAMHQVVEEVLTRLEQALQAGPQA
jgi:hypothetical protein